MNTVSGAHGPLTSHPCVRACYLYRRARSPRVLHAQRAPPPLRGDSGRPPPSGARPSTLDSGCVRDLQGLQHIVEGHRVDGIPQRNMDADQHGAQFVICQHHAHRHLLRPACPGWRAARLQQFGVARKSVVMERPAACNASLCRGAVTNAAISPRMAAASAAHSTHCARQSPRLRTHLAPQHNGCQCRTLLQHRDAVRRQVRDQCSDADFRHRKRTSRSGQPRWRSPAHRFHVTPPQSCPACSSGCSR
jgi:hypothetical protein